MNVTGVPEVAEDVWVCPVWDGTITGSKVEMSKMLETGDRGGARSPLSERVGISQQRGRSRTILFSY